MNQLLLQLHMDILFNQIKKEMYDITILKIKSNEYKVLVILGEDHLGGEDFNQRIINHIFSSIKVNDKYKNINFSNKNEERVCLKRINSKVEEIKIELSNIFESSFLIENLYEKGEFNLKIKREKYEDSCMSLWEKCFKKALNYNIFFKFKR